MPIGAFLDVTAPGLMVGLAIGRLGCFFIGCCTGRATASRWGVWSTDQRVGLRRIPVQLMESALAAGIAALATILVSGPHGGSVLVAAFAGYTLGRQGLLLLRTESRTTRFGTPLVAAAAALMSLAAIGAMIAIL